VPINKTPFSSNISSCSYENLEQKLHASESCLLHATGGENRAAMNEISFSFSSLSLYDSQGAFGDCQSMRKKKEKKERRRMK